jgi:hypothetical protein
VDCSSSAVPAGSYANLPCSVTSVRGMHALIGKGFGKADRIEMPGTTAFPERSGRQLFAEPAAPPGLLASFPPHSGQPVDEAGVEQQVALQLRLLLSLAT